MIRKSLKSISALLLLASIGLVVVSIVYSSWINLVTGLILTATNIFNLITSWELSGKKVHGH